MKDLVGKRIKEERVPSFHSTEEKESPHNPFLGLKNMKV